MHNLGQRLVSTAGVLLLVFTTMFGQDLAYARPIGSNSNAASMVAVRDLVESGQAKFHVVNKQLLGEKSEIELVLVDNEGHSIGGYAPPYLPTQAEARPLWKDFVTANLNILASPDQMSISETRMSEDQAFAVGFALDHSASMTMPRAVRMQRAIQNAMKTFDPQDYVTVVKFTGGVETEVELSKDREQYLSDFKVNGLQSRNNGTAIYDAALETIDQLAKAPDVSKRVMVLFTDGEDTESSAKVEDVIAKAKEHGVTIHVVTYGVSNDRDVKKIADATDGRLHKLQDVYDFDKVFLGIYNALRHTYTITVKHNRELADGRVQGATMTAAGQGSGSVKTPEVMAMMPKGRVTVANAPFDGLIMNVDLAFMDQSHDVSPDDVPLLDSIATVMIQKGDLALEILNSNTAGHENDENSAFMHRRAQAVRDLLIRRGVPAARIQSYAGKSASASPVVRYADPKKTTFVFTKM
jgi:Mg-chelatase subunit ChlD/outer membrane protein OmpA-like peptidoglycan-associated protein